MAGGRYFNSNSNRVLQQLRVVESKPAVHVVPSDNAFKLSSKGGPYHIA